jgi:dimethylsulfone monooxygenase
MREPLQFGYWATNLGGLVFSSMDETDWTFAGNVALARAAEEAGFDATLVAARFILTGGKAPHLEAMSTSAALAAATSRLRIVAAVHPGLWHPLVVAKMAATIDHIVPGRFGLNIVSGWFRKEFHTLGEPWLDHDERYRRSEEFIEILRGVTDAETFSYAGDFYRLHDAWLDPRPLPGSVEIYQGGNSTAARRMAARLSDWYFMNGDDVEGAAAQVADVRAQAAEHGRDVRFALNAFVVLGDSDEAAAEQLERIISTANPEAVAAFAGHARGAGASTSDRIGMWAQSDAARLVQPNDGFRSGLIGSAETVTARVAALHEVGVDMILCGFLDYPRELPVFGRRVIVPYRSATQPARG